MEMAIAVMKKTEHEPRKDGKVIPLVGAAIYKPDGTIETAYRGEIRDGDHAEYTLLEKKNRDQPLDNSLLFTTLEPCAPGARPDENKMSCAQRIVLARIKEVWVGIEDPDPTVDGQGIQFLKDSGITVHMFERDLQESIYTDNKEFIAQAMQRAEKAGKKKPSGKIVLSEFEGALENVNIQDLSIDTLEQYRIRAGISDPVGSPKFNRRLLQQGLLVKENGKDVPSGFGYMVFGNQPRNRIPQAGLLVTIHYPNGKEEIHEFNNPIITIPDLAIEWLKSKLPNVIDRNRIVREEEPAFPGEIVREAMVNALVHRDYNIAGAKCQLVVTEHTIAIKSPGSPLPPITLAQMQSFNAPMLSRNPRLHFVFRQMGLAEEAGLGLKTFKTVTEKYHLPLPKYTFEDPYLILTIYRSMESPTQTLPTEILESLNKDEMAGWQFLSSNIATTKTEYARHMKFDDRKAERHLKKFVELGILRRIGTARSTKYQVSQP